MPYAPGRVYVNGPITEDVDQCPLKGKWAAVNGLIGNAGLNGTMVFVLDWDSESATYNCLLTNEQVISIGRDVSDPMNQLLAIKPMYLMHESQQALEGCWAVVSGLASRPDLNSHEVYVMEWN